MADEFDQLLSEGKKKPKKPEKKLHIIRRKKPMGEELRGVGPDPGNIAGLDTGTTLPANLEQQAALRKASQNPEEDEGSDLLSVLDAQPGSVESNDLPSVSGTIDAPKKAPDGLAKVPGPGVGSVESKEDKEEPVAEPAPPSGPGGSGTDTPSEVEQLKQRIKDLEANFTAYQINMREAITGKDGLTEVLEETQGHINGLVGEDGQLTPGMLQIYQDIVAGKLFEFVIDPSMEVEKIKEKMKDYDENTSTQALKGLMANTKLLMALVTDALAMNYLRKRTEQYVQENLQKGLDFVKERVKEILGES